MALMIIPEPRRRGNPDEEKLRLQKELDETRAVLSDLLQERNLPDILELRKLLQQALEEYDDTRYITAALKLLDTRDQGL